MFKTVEDFHLITETMRQELKEALRVACEKHVEIELEDYAACMGTALFYEAALYFHVVETPRKVFIKLAEQAWRNALNEHNEFTKRTGLSLYEPEQKTKR
jgi:hypothetical protein